MVSMHVKQKSTSFEVLFGAGNQNRTDDLVITNDVLYRLSHTSVVPSVDDFDIITNHFSFVNTFFRFFSVFLKIFFWTKIIDKFRDS